MVGTFNKKYTVTGTDAYAGAATCGKDKYCGIKGKSFDAIFYSAQGMTGLVILYDKVKVGAIKAWVSETKYREGRGTVEDAIYFLSGDQKNAGFRVVKGKKSTGFFRSEVVDGLYVVVPKHAITSHTRAPEFRFVEKGGKITLHITDFDMGEED
jgi:hypothetical protein